MATKTALRPALTASGSLITWSPYPPPPTAYAKPGNLKFELVPIVNSIFFVPAACSVKDDAGTNVPLTTSSSSGLSFPAVSGKTYTLSVSYFVSPPNHSASARLQEDAPGASGGITIDDSTDVAEYTIQVN
jgi:hypothetical protein